MTVRQKKPGHVVPPKKLLTLPETIQYLIHTIGTRFRPSRCMLHLHGLAGEKSQTFYALPAERYVAKRSQTETADAVFPAGPRLLADSPNGRRLPALLSPEPGRNAIWVPLRSGRRRLGWLWITSPAKRTYRASDLSGLSGWAESAVTLLEPSLVRDRLERQNRELNRRLRGAAVQLQFAYEKIQQANHAQAESISVIAHELRNPITSITGFVKVLLKGQTGPLTSEQREFCEIIRKNTENMDRLISDLLDLTKLELGRLEMHLEPTPCRELINEAVLSLVGSSDSARARIREILPAGELFVQADRLRILQVVTNLLSNAFKYSPPNSLIRIACRPDGDDTVVFSVENQGVTLSPEERAMVFEKFFRSKNAPDANAGGSGLGLAVSHTIIQNHQGRIWVEPGPKGGNLFSFSLPRVNGPAAPPL